MQQFHKTRHMPRRCTHLQHLKEGAQRVPKEAIGQQLLHHGHTKRVHLLLVAVLTRGIRSQADLQLHPQCMQDLHMHVDAHSAERAL